MKMDESKVFGVSVRAFLAIIIVMTACAMTIYQIKIVEPFYSIVLFVIGFFYGQKNSSTNVGTPTETKV